ncbi:glycoside hydrolase family 15 protein [Acidihalobacter ferrooxydans]|uniref:Glycosyl hydrolase family 15 n=1 Tax=Acidihalobacter ferrooxydans TaxID=1765967 RepID=A0A1P8UHC8_9GAMM|nr:glycoside hydrolase family 15 protein [Acidihalobacter ferrooxydans]APZ43253.1 glycosyl hydrolase family 15 [Acidihalobacter ferrooxydans]
MKRSATNPLDTYYQQVSRIILARQNPITGLLPASTAITAHGDYTDAWVRDNVYSILAAWGLGLAYRRQDESAGRTVLLEQSVVKLMRGLLTAMMRQAPKVERFKQTLDPLDALHAKYDTATGDVVVGDNEWGHLQLDATALFLLMLAQMIASGLRIIFTLDEVNFVQNLVHYIGRAYRTPDYGIWERGNKANHGIAEINSSSVGMAKAALEAMNGFNLFGTGGGQSSVIHVVPDEIARARITLESTLPKESLSKEVDAATLSVVGFPAFAVGNSALVERTVAEVVRKLEGRYGCARFLRDGHQTVIEDPSRLHYEPEEMLQFEHIECEWPLFFTYLLLYHLYRGHADEARLYREKLDALLVERDGDRLLPELYRVPRERIEAEKAMPHSQVREPNENVPLVWAQSLYILGTLIQDGLLDVSDLDPLGRRLRVGRRRGRRVQFALLADSPHVKATLEEQGIKSETLAEVAPVRVHDADALATAYCQLGRNSRLGLSGRPLRHLRALATSSVYTFEGQKRVFQPRFMNRHDFYLALDNAMLVERLKMELAYVSKQWDAPGRPLVVIVVKERMLSEKGSRALLGFIEACREGMVEDTPVQLGRLASFLPTAGREQIDNLHGYRFPEESDELTDRPCFALLPVSDETPTAAGDPVLRHEASDADLLHILTHTGDLRRQFDALMALETRRGLDFDTGMRDAQGRPASVRALFEEIYIRACEARQWRLIRLSANVLQKHDIDLEGAATDLVVRRKAFSVSRSYNRHSTFHRPVGAYEILRTIREFNADDPRAQILTQELILNLGLLIRSHSELLDNMPLIRAGQLLHLIAVRQRRSGQSTVDDALDTLMEMAPHELASALRDVLTHYHAAENAMLQFERMQVSADSSGMLRVHFDSQMDPDNADAGDWHQWRSIQGSIGRYPDTFFEGVWDIVNQSRGLVIGDQWNPKRRIDHTLCADMTRGEKLFQNRVEHILNKTPAADARQLYIEALQVLMVVMWKNPRLRIDDTLFLDVIIGHAVRLAWEQEHCEQPREYDEQQRAAAWATFYLSPPSVVANHFMNALAFLLNIEAREAV